MFVGCFFCICFGDGFSELKVLGGLSVTGVQLHKLLVGQFHASVGGHNFSELGHVIWLSAWPCHLVPGILHRYTPENKRVVGKSPGSIGNTSSNGGCSIVMLVFWW